MAVDMNQSCIENTRFDDTERTDIILKDVVDNEKDWEEIPIAKPASEIKITEQNPT